MMSSMCLRVVYHIACDIITGCYGTMVNSTTGWQVVPGVCWLSLGEIDCKEGAAPKKPFHICLQILPNYQPNEK